MKNYVVLAICACASHLWYAQQASAPGEQQLLEAIARLEARVATLEAQANVKAAPSSVQTTVVNSNPWWQQRRRPRKHRRSNSLKDSP